MTPAHPDGVTLEEHLSVAGGELAPEDALDLALRTVADATGCRAAAICLFDPAQGVLRLGAEVGLSDEGCRRLRTIRRFAADAWELPLDSLLDGHVQVLVARDGEEPLPSLTRPEIELRAIACIPIRGGDGEPLGSLVLAAEDVAMIAEPQLESLRPALARIATIVATIGQRQERREVAAAAPRSLFESLADLALRSIEPAMREAFRLIEALPHPGSPRTEDTERLARALDHEVRERRALEEHLVDERVQQREKLIESETAWARERLRARDLERAVERLRDDLEAGRAREQGLKDDLLSAAARAAADRDEILRRARELCELAEAARANAAADAETARAALATAETGIMGLRDEIRQTWAEADRLQAGAQASRADVERLERTLQEARRREEDALERALQAEQQASLVSEEQRRISSDGRSREADLNVAWERRVQEVDRLAADLRLQLTEAHRDRMRLAVELAEAADQTQHLQTEIGAVMSRGTRDRDATLAQAREMVDAAERERAAAVAEAEAVRQALAQGQAVILRMEDDQVASEEGVAHHEAELEQAREQARSAEAHRVAVAKELEQVRGDLARARTMLLDGEDQVRRAQAEVARLEDLSTRARADEERTNLALLEARAQCADQAARLDELESETRALRTRVESTTSSARDQDMELVRQWRSKLEASETAWGREHLHREQLARQHDALAAEIQDLRDRDRRLREEIEAVQTRSIADREETLRRALELTEGAEAARAAAAAEAEAIRVTLANSQSVILSAEDDARRAHLEGERVTAELESLRSDHQSAVDALTQGRLDEARLRSRAAELEQEITALRQRTSQERASQAASAPARSAGAPPTAGKPASDSAALEPDDVGTGPRTIFVIDATDDSWKSAGDTETTVTIVPPAADLSARLATLEAKRLVVNLAAPGALDAIVALRRSGSRQRLWGCLSTPGATRALALGMVEVMPRPVDPDAIVSVVENYSARGFKILAAGGEANVFISLRQALTRAGMSVSIAWDAKQAADLIEMVRPEMVIVDLALPPRGGYGFVTQLTTLDPAPITVLVLRDGDPVPDFAAAIAERIGGATALPHHRLLARLFRPKRPGTR